RLSPAGPDVSPSEPRSISTGCATPGDFWRRCTTRSTRFASTFVSRPEVLMARRAGVFRVLLISLSPHAHSALLRSFERTGAVVLTASDPGRAVTLLRWSPELVLVDLALGAGLTPSLVAALNAGRARSSVLALHEGRLEDGQDDANELSVDGFCRAADLIPF